MSWKAVASSYANRGYKAYTANWDYLNLRHPVHWGDRTAMPSTRWPLGWGEGVIIDHGRQVVIDTRRNVQAEPKLIVELSGEEKDVIIQCRCGDRISLVKLLGMEAVSPIFDGISGRIRGLIENLRPEQPPQP